jgi:predicted aminopeptidase
MIWHEHATDLESCGGNPWQQAAAYQREQARVATAEARKGDSLSAVGLRMEARRRTLQSLYSETRGALIVSGWRPR